MKRIEKYSKLMVRIFLLSSWFILSISTAVVHADSAEVLPKGVFNLGAKGSFYFPITERYGPDGHLEDIAVDYNATLGSNVFSSLSQLEEAFGLPPGSANIGDSVVSIEDQFYDLKISLLYGLTDKVTIGIEIPYYWNKVKVDAHLDASNATVGLNPFYGTAEDPFDNAPFIPIEYGGVRLNTQQVKDFLSEGLDVDGDGRIDIPGFDYEPFENWNGSGFSDIKVGMRYQYFNSDRWRLAVTGGFRAPTGGVDNPANLIDIGYGSGAWGLFLDLNNDYTGIKNLLLNATLRYELIMPKEELLRVPDDVNQPITFNEERVDRDQGDIFEFEGSGIYSLTDWLSISLLYKYFFSLRDDVSGKFGLPYKSLEDETDAAYHLIQPGISFSTISLYKEKKFPLPMTLTLEYENYFAGRNFLKQELFTVGLSVFF